MNGPDRRSDAEWPIDPQADREEASTSGRPNKRSVATRGRGVSPIFIALGGVVLLLIVLWLFAGRGNSDQDKLSGNMAASKPAASDPEKRCASKQTYDLIKRELFRRAAQVRGSDQAAFDQLSGYSVIRVENPVMESQDEGTGAVSCSGSLSLDLPPGIAVVGGRRTLSSDLDYTVQPAADGSGNVVLLRNADGITAPLATLARVNQPSAAPAPAPQPAPTGAAPPAEPSQPAPPPQPSPQPASPPGQSSGANPSFNCANARTKGEIAVCSNPGLATLDRNMSVQYVRAISGASPQQRALLQSTRDRFLAYRDRCPNRSCIADAYEGRMREIRDIMEGRWQPPR